MKFVDLTDKHFGRWTVIGIHGKRGNLITWDCVCECGTRAIISGNSLTRKNRPSLSCGCLQKEKVFQTGKNNIIHGQTGTKLFCVWEGMLRRCTDANNKNYKNYGGRGITVCNEWHEFVAFRNWAISNKYRDDLTIERKNVNGNYCPENCCWATWKEQANNRRNNVIIKYCNTQKTLAEWSEITGLSAATISYRIKHGWSAERALTIPVGGVPHSYARIS